MLLEPKAGIIYGPVSSRRLGASLGINLLPPRTKVCTLDCAYCQYGWTDARRLDESMRPAFPSAAEVESALATALARLPTPPAFLTFSGHGEPTLHPQFAAIVDVVRAVRQRLAPSAQVAILSNSTRAALPQIEDALARLDLRIMKLDCGREETFRRYNGPRGSTTLDEITQALCRLPDVTLQVLFSGGKGGNSAPEEVTAWIERVTAIRPRAVQIYSLDRDWPAPDIEPLGGAAMEEIRSRLVARGIAAEVR